MKKNVLIPITFFCFSYCFGQNDVQGTVSDSSNGNALAGANILLLKAADSSLFLVTFADHVGKYVFHNVSNGKYFVASTFTGFHQQYSLPFQITASVEKLGNITIHLRLVHALLKEVIVTAKKPLFEQKIDRLTINVASSIVSAGNTALEVLERSPGITVDHQNNLLFMNGKSGVIIMLNGKISQMPLNAVVQLLSGMPTNSIETIELLTTPPANLNAEGNAGYINIILKENNNDGTNGSFSVTAGYNRGYISRNNFNINHRNGIVNVFGDLSFSAISSPLYADALNTFLYKSVLTTSQQNIERRAARQNINARGGIDVEIKSRTVLGLLFSGVYNHMGSHENTYNNKYKDGVIDTLIHSFNIANFQWNNYNGNINLQHGFGKENKLTGNIDYIYYSNSQPINYHSDYYDGAGTGLQTTQYRTKNTAPVHFWVGALDLSSRLGKIIIMEMGIKATLSNFDNDVTFEKLFRNIYVRDSTLSTIYNLKEDYQAAYTSFNISAAKKTSIKAGVRYEYTNSTLRTNLKAIVVDRHFGSLFPSFFLSHKFNDNNAINFLYSRRITRPTATDLAPFTYFQDPNTVVTGNPTLQPSFSNTVKLAYTQKNFFISLSFNKEDEAIVSFQPSSDSVSAKTVLSPKNLDNIKLITTSVSVPLKITTWWSFVFNGSGFWRQINAIYQKQALQFNQVNFQINGNMNFILPKAFSIEFSGFYSSRSLNGIVMNKENGTIDFGCRKRWAGKKSSLAFAANNIFNTLGFRTYTNIPEQGLSSALNIYDLRSYRLTYTRSFGKEKLKQRRDRSTGAEDEKNRVQ